MSAARFRKKPVVVEAIRFDGTAESIEAIEEWSDETCRYTTYDGIVIDTLEGQLNVSDGDWVIKGVKGEFYPCKPDIFEATYEAIP